MDEEKIFLLLKSRDELLEQDENGNVIVYGEASNENLDFQGEKVLQDALIHSADYFIQNGVVSYDHRHITEKDNPEKFIIGEPLDIRFKNEDGKRKVFVKFKLFKDNELAKEIIQKLRNGARTVKISIGGKMAEKEPNPQDHSQTVTYVLWDEIALTYKPVNQSLSPVTLSADAFVKSLMSESTGKPLVKEDLYGSDDNGEKEMIVSALNYAKEKNVDLDRYLEVLKTKVSTETFNKIKKEIEKMKKENDLLKSLDEGLDKLLKSQQAAEEPEEESAPFPKPAEDDKSGLPQSEEEVSKTDDTVAEGDGDGEGDGEGDDEGDGEDFEKELESLRAENKSLKKAVEELKKASKHQTEILSKMYEVQKSIAAAPGMRKSIVAKNNRFGGEPKKYTREEILQKAKEAVTSGKLSLVGFCGIEERLNKGISLEDSLLKSIM